MSQRELHALGTSSQVPTRLRNHNGYFLRWDDEGFLFDPGEGTQRQMLFGDLSARSVTRIFVTHFHGDHCLGLAGIIQRLSLDNCPHPVHVHFPASGQQYFERLRDASIYYSTVTLVPCPVPDDVPGLRVIAETARYTLEAHVLDHPVPACGYRVVERPGRRFLPERLAAAGIAGPLVGELARAGVVTVGGRAVTVEEMSEPRPGSAFAFVMDTRPCAGAEALAEDVDLLVMESTYAEEHAALAAEYGHSTAADAARTARSARARALAITHFSSRYSEVDAHLAEARAIFPETVALRDLDRVPIPRR